MKKIKEFEVRFDFWDTEDIGWLRNQRINCMATDKLTAVCEATGKFLQSHPEQKTSNVHKISVGIRYGNDK